MKLFRLAIKLLIREWRAGELTILFAALLIAVSALSSINFYVDRIARALDIQASELLGGDLIVSSPLPISDDWVKHANLLHLHTAQQMLFPTVVVAGQALQLADIKAVTTDYPLIGQLQISDNLRTVSRPVSTIPAQATVWVDAKLLSLLAIPIGTKVTIGVSSFTITHLLTYEPDAQSNVFTIAPRVLMNINDVSKTQVVQPGSRITYHLLLTGDADNINQFKQWLIPQLLPQQKLMGVNEGRPQIRVALARATNYLMLAVLICVVLAGVAIAITARRYAKRHYDAVALLRCMGLTQYKIIQLFSYQLLILGLVGSILGCMIGYFAQFVLEKIFTGWFNVVLPQVSIASCLIAIVVGLCILIGFTLAPLLRLQSVTPLRVFSREIYTASPSYVLTYACAMIIIGGLLFWHSTNYQLTLLTMYCIGFTVLILYGVSIALIKLLKLMPAAIGVTWQYGLTNLARRQSSSTVQLIAFGLVIMVALLLSFIRTDLITTWHQELPKNAPNYFAINIQPEDVNALTLLLAQHHIKISGIYPMVRGRLIGLNGRPIKQMIPKGAENNEALNRELNLTWTMQLPSDNHIVTGKWWTTDDSGKSLVSIERNLAEQLGIHIGNTLEFQVGDQHIKATVYSTRTLKWDSFHPNFYMMFPPNVLNHLPSTYITSFYLPQPQNNLLVDLVRQYPSVTLIDVNAILNQVHTIIETMSAAIGYILVFTLFACFAILYATLQSSVDERLHEGALLRTLGASTKQLNAILATEFICLGLLSGLFAAMCASLIAFVLANYVFDINYTLHLSYWLYSLIAGALIVTAAGLLGTRAVVNQSPLKVLRENEN